MIDYVIVKKSCGVQEFKNQGELEVIVPSVAAKSGGQNHQKRAEALASAPHDIASHNRNERYIGVQKAIYLAVDSHQIRANTGIYSLLEIAWTGRNGAGEGGSIHYLQIRNIFRIRPPFFGLSHGVCRKMPENHREKH
jgi:hypothetical protein